MQYEDRISYAQRFSFSLMCRYYIPNYAQNIAVNLGLKEQIADTVTLKHSKQLMHVKRAYVFSLLLLYSDCFMSVVLGSCFKSSLLSYIFLKAKSLLRPKNSATSLKFRFNHRGRDNYKDLLKTCHYISHIYL